MHALHPGLHPARHPPSGPGCEGFGGKRQGFLGCGGSKVRAVRLGFGQKANPETCKQAVDDVRRAVGPYSRPMPRALW